MHTLEPYDLVGVGFGPSNLSLAIALAEAGEARLGNTLFLEQQPGFCWHGSMLLEGSTMQISFLKDLVSLRNPRSRFSFINYLHEQGRLSDFINLQTFFPTRLEFNDYLRWSADKFADNCRYNSRVTSVSPILEQGRVTELELSVETPERPTTRIRARNLVMGVGGRPNIPQAFAPHRDNDRVIHSSDYLRRMDEIIRQNRPLRRVAVIGAGQSAAEIFHDLGNRFGHLELSLISRCRSMKPSDDSPFVNEIFNPEYTDYLYDRQDSQRQSLMEEYRNTNYSVVDMPLLETLFQWRYQQQITGETRLSFMFDTRVEQVEARDNGLQLALSSGESTAMQTLDVDLVILATGYRRDGATRMLEAIQPYLATQDGTPQVTRQYELQTDDRFEPRIYLQGACERSHGLSDTLLSVLPTRAQEIAQSLAAGSQSPAAHKPINARISA
ncbi:lysine N(6)-hydroxylase/L-ornithine N(5)-oxygenase family protein [Marinobacterium lacunae]|nr:lysine N(6)-hydroxylase/L-ornithine N(5)-oxygenase family protein [Marinobacterium lacunae]